MKDVRVDKPQLTGVFSSFTGYNTTCVTYSQTWKIYSKLMMTFKHMLFSYLLLCKLDWNHTAFHFHCKWGRWEGRKGLLKGDGIHPFHTLSECERDVGKGKRGKGMVMIYTE